MSTTLTDSHKVSSKISALAIDALPEFDDHESVTFIQDRATGLRGFIAIHNTNRGPAVGGTRYWPYKSDEEALRDVLRLSRAMTYKCALADLPYGGGKTVLIAPHGKKKDAAYLASYAHRLNVLGGSFYTGEDVGLDESDILTLEKHSKYIIGRPDVGELPSHWAARSVMYSMQAALMSVFGNDSIKGRSVAVKGVGNVGLDLCKMIAQAGGKIFAADISPERIRLLKREVPTAEIVSPEMIHSKKVDIFAPCALGSELTMTAIRKLGARIVCGAANNQLPSEESGFQLHKRGILYIPDYVGNGGGLINVVDELRKGGYDRSRVDRNVKRVGATVRELIQESQARDVPTALVADEIGRSRIFNNV